MKQADRCCVDCTYFDKEEKECHKSPPRLYIKTDEDTQIVQQVTVALWPFVDVTDWCGEFKENEVTQQLLETQELILENKIALNAMKAKEAEYKTALKLIEPEPEIEPEPDNQGFFEGVYDTLKSFGIKGK